MQSLSVRWSIQWYCKLQNILPTFHIPSFYNKLHLVDALSSSFWTNSKQVLVLVKQFTSAPSVETFISNRYSTHGSSFSHSVVCKLRNMVNELSRDRLLYANAIYHSHQWRNCRGQRGEFPPPWQAKCEKRTPLNLYFSLSCCFFAFFGLFSGNLGFSIAIHNRIHHQFSIFVLTVG